MKTHLSPPLELLDLAVGYQRSKTLFTFVEFDVPMLLARGSMSLAEIAQRLQIHPRAADRFLNACVALGLLERTGEEFRNTELAQQFLVRDTPNYLGELLTKYNRTSYPLWSDLTGKLREWQPGATNDEVPVDEDQGEESLGAQHNLALLVGHALGQAHDFSQHKHLLDLGGGTGAMSIGVCEYHDGLQAIVYDLPEIAGAAQSYIDAAGLTARIEVRRGNFKEDALPTGFDVALLANLLSTASEETNRELLRRIYERLPKGGACIISGWILDDARTSPLIPVLFCLEDINWQAPDVERSASTYERWMADAGFAEIERKMYSPPTSLIVGWKRAAN